MASGLFHVAALVLLGERHRGRVIYDELIEVVIRTGDVTLALRDDAQVVVLEREPIEVIRLGEEVCTVARSAGGCGRQAEGGGHRAAAQELADSHGQTLPAPAETGLTRR